MDLKTELSAAAEYIKAQVAAHPEVEAAARELEAVSLGVAQEAAREFITAELPPVVSSIVAAAADAVFSRIDASLMIPAPSAPAPAPAPTPAPGPTLFQRLSGAMHGSAIPSAPVTTGRTIPAGK